MSDNIPFEIQTEIIKRVSDVKSLVRFRSVSKLWKSSIDTSEFIAGYRARKTQPHSSLLRYTENDLVKYVSVINHTLTRQHDLAPNVSALMKQFNTTIVIGSSRGLLCLYSLDKLAMGMIILWNPCIRRSVGILGAGYFEVFGFAVCPVTNEPTIVKVSFPWKVEIFTLSSKKWSQIQCRKPCELISLCKSQVVIGSCIYRVAQRSLPGGYLTEKFMIMSFDLIAKEFRAINVPDKIIFPVPFIISKLKGSLVVIVPRGEVNVWKLEPDCSFTQLYTINTPDSYITGIFGFTKNGKVVVETQDRSEEWLFFGEKALKVYDPCSIDINNLWFSGQVGSFFISSYKETLHLLDHSDSCVYP